MAHQAAKRSQGAESTNGPIEAREHLVQLAQTINKHLTIPIAILPQEVGDTVKPWMIGVGPIIATRLKRQEDLGALKWALRRYAYSRNYLLACAQPGAKRHDIDGNAVAPVSEEDRVNALEKYQAMRTKKPNTTSNGGE